MKENYWKKGTSLHAGTWGSHTDTGFWGLRDWRVKHCEERFRRAFQHMEEERKWVSGSMSICVSVWLFGTPWTVARQTPSSVTGIFQARIREQVAISYSKGSSDSGMERGLLCLLHWQVDSYHCSTWEAHFCIYIHMCVCVCIHTHTHTNICIHLFITKVPIFGGKLMNKG